MFDNAKKTAQIAEYEKQLIAISIEQNNLSDLSAGIDEIGASDAMFTFKTETVNGAGYVGTEVNVRWLKGLQGEDNTFWYR